MDHGWDLKINFIVDVHDTLGFRISLVGEIVGWCTAPAEHDIYAVGPPIAE